MDELIETRKRNFFKRMNQVKSDQATKVRSINIGNGDPQFGLQAQATTGSLDSSLSPYAHYQNWI